ncbi:hypothetical protein GFL43_01510 [Rhizobium laguerreae]|nr:hypothetical protein [Rhizobium laguerreae]NKN03676.1 hypothetical protein [Rhizobium laguerreae]
MSNVLEHDAEKCERFSDGIMLQLFNSEQDSDFRPNRPKIILFCGPTLERKEGGSMEEQGERASWKPVEVIVNLIQEDWPCN